MESQNEHDAQSAQFFDCIVCGQPREMGIRIYDQWVCIQCEAEIVQTDVEDVKYPFFIHQLKRIWYRKDA